MSIPHAIDCIFNTTHKTISIAVAVIVEKLQKKSHNDGDDDDEQDYYVFIAF